MNSLLHNRKGTTLVEILITMVILLVGIMIVVQMFPTGFRVVRAAENWTIATKLAQAEIERWKNMPGNIPDGILPIDSDGNVLNDNPPGPPFTGFTQSTLSSDLFEAGNTMNSRYVRNETTPIPVGSYFTTGAGAVYGSKYTLAFSPIEVTADTSHPGLYNGITIKSGDLLRREGDSDSYMYLKAGQYGVDYTLNGTSFSVSFSYDNDSSHVYYISYSYWAKSTSGSSSNLTLFSVVDQPVSPTTDGNRWTAVPVTPISGYTLVSIEEHSDSCARGFVPVPASDSTTNYWSSDPYEFALADSIMGVVAFNPRAKNMTEYTARGVRPITARIDYRIYDPRIIREDKVVGEPNEDPNNTDTNDHTYIKLALSFILDAGDPTNITDGDPTDNPDEPTFEGLVKSTFGKKITSASDLVVSQSVLIIDLATGLRIDMNNVIMTKDDFKNGVVHLPESANLLDWNSNTMYSDVQLTGRHLRFFYRADGDWSIQCQKAYSYYQRKYDTAQTDYWHYKLWQASDGKYKLLFAQCDAGKTVSVDYTYLDSSGNPHKVVGQPLQISFDDWIVDPDNSSIKCAYVTLDGNVDANSRIIVVGISFRARVVWRDGTYWRHVDIDTNLTRNSSP